MTQIREDVHAIPTPTEKRGRTRFARGTGASALCAAVIAVFAGYAAWAALATSGKAPMRPEQAAQTLWAPCNRNAANRKASTFVPLTDKEAASLVTAQPENRPYNGTAYSIGGDAYPPINDYVPSSAQLRQFEASKTSAGQPIVEFNPYLSHVDGRDGLSNPSTDDLIQWAAHKWGIPENWLRAEYAQESYWNGFQLGDETDLRSRTHEAYPSQARISSGPSVYQSMGITQVKWNAEGSVGAGTEPLRWESTAFNIDYQAATVRFYYDNPGGARSAWGDSSYGPCQQWNSIGGWFEPYPWGNAGQKAYVREVRQHLAHRDWTSSSFEDWTPASFPPGVRFSYGARRSDAR